MAANDFITVFGRLLSDGAMRDAFAADPRGLGAQLKLCAGDRAALMQLSPADLEFQADILIRKRLDGITGMIPETCRLLGSERWPSFRAYARTNWPGREQSAAADAHGFCRHLHQHLPDALCEAELNRLRFVLSQDRFAIHFIPHKNKRNQSKAALQILLRFGRHRQRETTLYFSL